MYLIPSFVKQNLQVAESINLGLESDKVKLKTRHEDLIAEIHAQTQKCMDLQQQIDSITSDNVTMRNERDSLTAKHVECVQQLLHFETECEKLSSKNQVLNSAITALHTRSEQIKAESQQRQSLLDESTGQLTLQADRLNALDKEKTALTTELAKQRRQHDSVKAAIVAVEEQVTKLERKLSDAKYENGFLSAKLKEVMSGEDDKSQQIETLQTELDERKAANVKYETQLFHLETAVKEAGLENLQHQSELKSALAGSETLQLQLIDAQVCVAEQKKRTDELEQHIESVNKDKSVLVGQLSAAQNHEIELTAQLNRLELAIGELKESKHDVENKMKAIERDGRASDDLIKQLTNLLDEERKSAQLLREQVEIGQSRANEHRIEIDRLIEAVNVERLNAAAAHNELGTIGESLAALQIKSAEDVAQLTAEKELQLADHAEKETKLSTELRCKSETILALERSLAAVRQELSDTQTKMAEQQKAFVDRTEQHREYVVKMEQMLTHCDALETENKLLLDKCDKLREAVTDECAKFMEYKNRCNLLETEMEVLKSITLVSLRTELAANKTEQDALIGQLKRGAAENQQSYNEIERLRKDAAERQQQLQDGERLLADTIVNYEAKLSASEATKQEQIREIEEEKTRIEAELQQATETVADLESKFCDSSAMCEQIRSEQMVAAEKAKQIQNELMVRNSEATDNLVELTNELADAKSTLSDTQTKLQVSLESGDVAAGQIKTLQADLLGKSAELAALKPLYAGEQNENRSKAEALALIVEERAKLEERLIALQQSVADVKEMLDAARQRNVALETERNRFSADLQQLRDEHKLADVKHTQQLTQLQTECGQFESNLAAMRLENDRLAEQNAKLLDAERAAAADRTVAAAKMTDFLERIHALEEEKDELARDVQVAMQYRLRVEQLQTEAAQMQEKLCHSDGETQKIRDEFARCHTSLLSMNVMLSAYFGDDEIAPAAENVAAIVTQQIERLQREQCERTDELQQANVQLKLNCDSTMANLERLTSEYATLRALKEDEERRQIDELARLREELSVAESTRALSVATVECECEKLREQLASATATVDNLQEERDAKGAESQETVSILVAKLMQSRSVMDELEKKCGYLENDVQAAELKVTNTRIELEGKLEKMKEKMVSRFVCCMLRSGCWWWSCVWGVATTTAALFWWGGGKRLGK